MGDNGVAYKREGIYDKKKENGRVHFLYQAEFVKKSELTNSAFLLYVAKNVRITDNKSKSFVFCVFMTRGMKLFYFCTFSF